MVFLTCRLPLETADTRRAMCKITGSSCFIEVPHVVRGTEDIWYTVTPVGAVDAGRIVPAGMDHRVWICPAYSQQG